jgi:hypothetical protein
MRLGSRLTLFCRCSRPARGRAPVYCKLVHCELIHCELIHCELAYCELAYCALTVLCSEFPRPHQGAS